MNATLAAMAECSSYPFGYGQQIDRLTQGWIDVCVYIIRKLRAGVRLSRADGTTANRRNSPQPLPWTS
jgi:hypothetical protein